MQVLIKDNPSQENVNAALIALWREVESLKRQLEELKKTNI